MCYYDIVVKGEKAGVKLNRRNDGDDDEPYTGPVLWLIK